MTSLAVDSEGGVIVFFLVDFPFPQCLTVVLERWWSSN